MIKRFLLTLLFLAATLFAADARLNDYPKASEWEQAAEAGDADAMYNLAHTYQMQVKDYDKAIYWYKRAYEKEPSNDIANNLGYLYDDLKKYDTAIKYYKLAAKNGYAQSALNLGVLYDEKLHDYSKAIEWYEQAYNAGNMGGRPILGIFTNM
jgi:TPR repeat protein